MPWTKEERRRITHMGFWWWQYQMRNQTYIDDYLEYDKATDEKLRNTSGVWSFIRFGGIAHKVPAEIYKDILDFSEKHNRLPKPPLCRIKTTDLVVKAFKKKIKYNIDSISDIDMFGYKKNSIGIELLDFCLEENNRSITVKIDLDERPEVISSFINFIHNQYNTWTGKPDMVEVLKIDKPSDTQYSSSFIKMMDSLIHIEGKKQPIADITRAVGLWLYDYIDENLEVTTIKGVKKYKSHSVGSARLILENAIKSKLTDSEYEQFPSATECNRAYRLTCKCIEAVEVLYVSEA